MDKPAIVKETLSLKEQVNQIKTMYSDHTRTSVQRAMEIGAMLNDLKQRCIAESVEWIPTLEEMGVPGRTARTYMYVDDNKRLVLSFIGLRSQCATSLVEIIEYIQKEKAASKPKWCNRKCRVNGGCKKCGRNQPAPKPPKPPSFEPTPKLTAILDRAVEHQQLARKAVTLSKAIRKLERDEWYRKATGVTTEPFAEYLLKASKQIVSSAPVQGCELCKGDVEPNPDSEPCQDCGGKGVLTSAEVQALAERVNF